MASPIISQEDFEALLNLRDTLDRNIDQASSAYMKSTLTTLRASVAIKVIKAQACKERATLATHRKNLQAMRPKKEQATA